MSTRHGGSGGSIVNVWIRVNAVRPGFIYTELHASGGEPGRVERVKSRVPLQRGGTPEEVARGHRLAALGRSVVHDRRLPGCDRRADRVTAVYLASMRNRAPSKLTT